MSIPADQSKAIATDQPVRIYREDASISLAKWKINYIAHAHDVKSEVQSIFSYNTLTVQASSPNEGLVLSLLNY